MLFKMKWIGKKRSQIHEIKIIINKDSCSTYIYFFVICVDLKNIGEGGKQMTS